MKKVMILSFIMFALMLCFSLTAAGEPDVKGSKDHLLLSRMPDFYISEYKYTDYASHKFID